MNTAQKTQPVDKINILIVDDKRSNLVALEAILACPDYNLISVTSGSDALKYALREDFAVILLDVMMPELDGFEVARLIRQGSRSRTTPIIFLTAIAKDTRFQHEGYAVGAVDYLHKPLDAEIVKAKVAVFVELFRKNLMIQQQEQMLRAAEKREQEYKLLQMRHESEQHYRELADAIPQVVWTATPTGKLTFVSQRWFIYTGASHDEMDHFEAFSKYFHPDDVDRQRAAWAEAEKTLKQFTAECRILQQDRKQYRWHLCHAIPEHNLFGQIIGWLGTMTDIHSQKREEEAQRFIAKASGVLAENLNYKTTIANAARLAIPSLADMMLVDYLEGDNRVCRTVVGSLSEDNKPLIRSLQLAFNDPAEAARLGAVALETGRPELLRVAEEPERLDPLVKTCFETDAHLNSIVSVPMLARGRVVGAISALRFSEPILDAFDLETVRSVTRHSNLAIENALAHEDVQRINRAKDEFLAILSHELRTPLNAMIGWAQFLRLGSSDPTVLQGVEVIERNGQMLSQLVSDLLDVSRIVAGKLQIEKRPVEMNSFLNAAVEVVRPMAESKSIKLNCCLGHERAMILGDQERLQQVFWNLLINAIKFTDEGGKVEVFVGVVNDSLLVTVRDTGIGIKPENLRSIFDRFSQVDSSTKRRHSGLGLGLAIVKHLAELHGGTVSVQSDGPGKGSCFTVALPIVVTEREGSMENKAKKPTDSAVNLAGANVFVVDDDPTARDIVVAFLKRSGASVRSAGSVQEALPGIKQFCPDVVISDIGMPDEDGFDLLRIVKSLESELGKSIKVAALTAYASPEDALRAYDAGFDAHFTKPFKFDELLSAIAKLSGRRQEQGGVEESLQ